MMACTLISLLWLVIYIIFFIITSGTSYKVVDTVGSLFSIYHMWICIYLNLFTDMLLLLLLQLLPFAVYLRYYTVVHKTHVTLLLSISSPIIDRFLQFVHWLTLKTICNNMIIIYSTTPYIPSLHYLVNYDWYMNV